MSEIGHYSPRSGTTPNRIKHIEVFDDRRDLADTYNNVDQGRGLEHQPKGGLMKHGSGMEHGGGGRSRPYQLLMVMIGLSFLSMYILMYAMVDRLENVYPNYNQLYMASLMTAPMIVLELLVMKHMYDNKKLNLLLVAAGVVLAATSFGLIRGQTAIGDKQFLKSMIPHHAGAILMCEQSSVQAPEIKQLCQGIISGQQSEISQMKALLQNQR
ncbi:MAG TPA: DUF305 domain-containing protein [Terriglobales bacterium]|nr:DUF305 domain-containing protein [Terriglobales bacterium]